MAAGSTYTPIATTTLTSGQTSVTLNSFSGYTDLVLVASVQASLSGQGLTVQFNGDTGSNYSSTIIRGSGSAVSSGRTSNDNQLIIANQAEPPTSAFGVYIMNLNNYSNTTTYKTVLSRGNNASAGLDAITSLWRSTSAITSMVIKISSGNMQTGSTFTLYGILAA